MTIKEFLQNHGAIEPEFKLISTCSDYFSYQDADDLEDDTTSDSLVQASFDSERYSEDQEFDDDSETFTIIAPDKTIVAVGLTEKQTDEFIGKWTKDTKPSEFLMREPDMLLAGGRIIEKVYPDSDYADDPETFAGKYLLIGKHEFKCAKLIKLDHEALPKPEKDGQNFNRIVKGVAQDMVNGYFYNVMFYINYKVENGIYKPSAVKPFK